MKNIVDILKSIGAVITDDHFVYTSGKHGSIYINKDALYPRTSLSSEVGKMFAEHCKDMEIDVVAAPALGGIILSQWTAHHMSNFMGKEVLAVYTEKTQDKNQIFTRNYDKLVKGKKVLVIEDLTTTGMSVKKVVDSVKAAGGETVMVGVMVNRNPEGVNESVIGAPYFALGVLPADAVEEKDCILCKKNVPINTHVGHGRKYIEERKKG